MTDSETAFLHAVSERRRNSSKRKIKVINRINADDVVLFGQVVDDDGDTDDDYEGDGDSTSTSNSDEDSTEEEEDKSSISDQQPSTSTSVVLETNNNELCSLCLNLRLKPHDSMVTCDRCSITVHEECYGVRDTADDSDTASSSSSTASTEPWFCEACLFLTSDYDRSSIACELCPSTLDGPWKRTVSGSWMHLQCVLYVGDLYFHDPAALSFVSTATLHYSRYGAHSCTLCTDTQQSFAGVVLECEAGMCRQYFHATCAHRAGLLNPLPEDVAQQHGLHPYATCRAHSDRETARRRAALAQRAGKAPPCLAQLAGREREKYAKAGRRMQRRWEKAVRELGTQSQQGVWESRPLFSSAAFVRGMRRKVEHAKDRGERLEEGDGEDEVLCNAESSTSVPIAFHPAYLQYYSQREGVIEELQVALAKERAALQKCSGTAHSTQTQHESTLKATPSAVSTLESDVAFIRKISASLSSLGCRERPALPLELARTFVPKSPTKTDMSSPSTSSATANVPAPRPNGLLKNHVKNVYHSCVQCKSTKDQHLLIDCDTCLKYFHIACLDPPLKKMPIKTPIYGWECSVCNESSSSSEEETALLNVRCLREAPKAAHRYSDAEFGSSQSGTKKRRKTTRSLRRRSEEKEKEF